MCRALYFCLYLASLSSAAAQLQELPKVEPLTPQGYKLIIDGETGGEWQYKKWPHPEWPKGASGVTWGIGYDATAQSESIIRIDWKKLGKHDADRLAATHPLRHDAARRAAYSLRDITISWLLSLEVYQNVDLARTDQLCRRSFPGFDDLRPTARDAIRSLVFNRGACFAGPRYKEMRDIRDAVPGQNYEAMARAER